MRGEIGVESTPGLGSTFWFKVPLKVKKEQRSSRRNQLSGRQAIIISENVSFSNILGTYLAFTGMGVETAAGYEKALALLDAARAEGRVIDMVLVDNDLSENAAESLIGQVRADSSMATTKIMVMGYRSRMMVDRPHYLDHAFAELPMPVRRNRLWEVTAAATGLESLDGRLLYSNRESDVGPRQFAPPDSKTAREAGALILVAEDNPVNQKVIRMLLDRLGYAADIVDDGVLALAAIRNDRYGLLLTDCHMPNMDGYDLTRHIRADEAREGGPHLPIVALTADALIGVEDKCRECGMDAFIKKPISRSELNTIILQLLPAASALRRHAGGTVGAVEGAAQGVSPGKAGTKPEAEGKEEKKAAFDITYLGEVTGGDPEMTRMLIDSFIETTRPLIDDLVRAFDACDPVAVGEVAHAIKGSSNMSGALRLGEICEFIQESAEEDDLDSVHIYKDVLHKEFDAFLKAWKSHADD